MDDAAIDARGAALSLEQKVRLLTGADFWALHEEPAAGLRRLVTSDGPAGVRGERWDEREPSANVPSPTALAATLEAVRAEAAKYPASHPLLFATSAENGEGIADLRTAILEAVDS